MKKVDVGVGGAVSKSKRRGSWEEGQSERAEIGW